MSARALAPRADRSWQRRTPPWRAVAGCALVAAALLAGAAGAGKPVARAAELRSSGAETAPADRFATPAKPPSLEADSVEAAEEGIQIALGAPFLTVQSDRLTDDLGAGTLFSRGAQVGVARVWRHFRLVYERLVYRVELPEEIAYSDAKGNFLAIEADQLWLFHGGRPTESLYLGYGLGVQRRQLRLLDCPPTGACATSADTSETVGMAGLLAEWSFRRPFSLQLGLVREAEGKLVTLSGYVVRLAYLVPW